MHRKTVSLTDRDESFIAAQLDSGEFNNASEIVRAGLRLLEREQLQRTALRQAVAEGDADLAAGRSRAYRPGEMYGALETLLKALPVHDR